MFFLLLGADGLTAGMRVPAVADGRADVRVCSCFRFLEEVVSASTRTSKNSPQRSLRLMVESLLSAGDLDGAQSIYMAAIDKGTIKPQSRTTRALITALGGEPHEPLPTALV